jgi:bifunctional non-homologous end joining protein LigD
LTQPVVAFNVPLAAGQPTLRVIEGGPPSVFQKRAPEQRPEWIETVELRFPSGRTAREIVVRDAAQLLWMVRRIRS